MFKLFLTNSLFPWILVKFGDHIFIIASVCIFSCFYFAYTVFFSDVSAIFSVGHKQAFLVKIASIRELVQGAPLRAVFKQLVSRGVKSDLNKIISIVHRPNESYFIFPQVNFLNLIWFNFFAQLQSIFDDYLF